MADLTDLQSAQSVKIIGSSSSGVENTPLDVDTDGRAKVQAAGRNSDTLTNIPIAVDTEGRVYTNGTSALLSPLPGFVARSNKVLAAGASLLNTYLMTDDIAIVDFHFGGRGPGQASLLRINAATTEQVPGGGFNSPADVAMWTNAGIGSSSALVWAYNTVQFTEGTGSAAVTFTQSDNNNYPAIKYTWSSPKDVSQWRYIIAQARVTVAAGGSQTRTISAILTDINGATRTYSLAGTTTTPPFSTEQWHTITGEIETPTSSTGTFDPYNVSSILLKLEDGGNKAGTIYWDNVRFATEQLLIERIYIEANRTFQLILNPVELFDTGETLGLLYKNNDTVSREFTVTAKGVER